MGYSVNSSNIKNKLNGIIDLTTNIESISFDRIWKGAACNSLTGAVNDVIRKLKIEQDKVEVYASLLELLQNYMNTKEKIEALQRQLNSTPVDESTEAIRAYLYSMIKQYISDNAELREKLQSAFSQFGSVGTELNLVTYAVKTTPDYLTNVQELKSLYDNKWGDADNITSDPLTKLNDYQSIYNYYNQYGEDGKLIEGSGQAYVEGLITNIQKKTSGREAAVNSALTMLQLAADQGVKLDYEHKGTMTMQPYVPTSEVASGVDCNPFASWVVDKGTKNGFQWRPVGEFKYVGETLGDWTQAQPGDVFVNNGHVGIIIENNPETGTFTCAEASGSQVGIILQSRTYGSMKNEGYQIQDMTSVYDGTENTDRDIFNQHVDWNTYQKPV